jgi:glycosyltransferase involved in cell wall biosynthesis
MIKSPFFSIIIPTRNRGVELQNCLDAINKQTCKDFEVLIVDDGSSLDIREQHKKRLQRYGNRFHWHEVNASDSLGSGPSVVRNIGIEKSQGEYIAFCDDDDCWEREDHLAIAAEALKKNKAQVYFSGMQIKDEQGITQVAQQMQKVTDIALTQGELHIEGVYSLDPEQVLSYPDYAHLNITIVHNDLLKRLGKFWPHTRFAEDVDLFVRICDQANGILFRPEICATHFAPEKRQIASVSNQLSLNDKRLLEISVYQHLLTCCHSKPALIYAKKSLAVTEKMLTEELISENKITAAKIISGAAFSALPTLKWGLYSLWLRFKG